METERMEFLRERRFSIGASEISSVLNMGNYGCQKRLVMEKLGVKKDFDYSDKPELRRGRRLEQVAKDYYSEKTCRNVLKAHKIAKKGKPFLTCTPDGNVYKEGRDDPGYFEAKVLGRDSFWKVKKEGLYDEYISQVQYGMGVGEYKWGSFCIYQPDMDELLYWDFEIDEKLSKTLQDKAEELWLMNVYTQIEPEALPLGSKACSSCEFSLTCRKGIIEQSKEMNDLVIRDDLEEKAKALADLKNEIKVLEKQEEELKTELISGIQEKPGTYRFGNIMGSFSMTTQDRFDSTAFKKKNPEAYKEFIKKSTIKKFTLKGNE